jgi:outer membrane autotransporter protein
MIASMSSAFCRASLAAIAASLCFAPAHAHTSAVGYENAGPGSVNFWYGTYHAETTFTEGSMQLVNSDGSFSVTVPFTLLLNTTPTGLIGNDSVIYAAGYDESSIYVWQGVTFNDLVADTYTFTYIPIAFPTQDWNPLTPGILSSTVTLSAAIVGGNVIDNSQPYFTEDDAAAQASELTFDGGTFAPTTSSTLAQNTTLNVGGGTVDTTSGDAAFTGNVAGVGGLTKTGAGTLTLSGENSYSGGTTVSEGTLVGTSQSLQGTIANNGDIVFAQQTDGVFAGDISGSGSVTKTGAGRLDLTGTSTYAGQTTVEDGRLAVNGSLANSIVEVGSGASIGGNGTVGGLIVRTNATAAPGNSIGKLTAATFVVFEPNSFYAVEVDAAGHNDRIVANGAATLQGGTVQVLAENGNYNPATSYTILTADGGVTGKFANATSNLAFLTPSLIYGTNSVQLTLTRNDLSFAAAGKTRNQIATGVALDKSFAIGSAVYNTLVGATAGEAARAFDALSGEIHGSALSAAAQDANLLRRTAFDRVGDPVSGRDVQLWSHVVGTWSDIDGNGNAADVERSSQGFLVGAEFNANDRIKLGVASGYTDGTVRVNDRRSRADVRGIHGIAYAGAHFGALNVRLGGSYSGLKLDSQRTASFRSFDERLSAKYNGSITQLFGEMGYRVALGAGSVEPFVGLTGIRLHNNSFAEQGGTAALSGESQSRDFGWSTLGLRTTIGAADAPLAVRLRMGWQHALSGQAVSSDLAFAGGNGFTVQGAPLARDSALTDAGVEWRAAPRLTLGVGYAGTIANQGQDHSVRASLSFKL